jgi:chorismate synthase
MVVPACSAARETIVSPVLAKAFLEKYGGDSVDEIRRRYKPSGIR